MPACMWSNFKFYHCEILFESTKFKNNFTHSNFQFELFPKLKHASKREKKGYMLNGCRTVGFSVAHLAILHNGSW